MSSTNRRRDVLVREASEKDLPALAELVRRQVEWHRDVAGYYDLRAGFDWGAYVRAQLGKRRRTILVAERVDSLVGFISTSIDVFARAPRRRRAGFLRRLVGSPAPSPPVQPVVEFTRGVIEDCYVDEDNRRRGVGEALVSKALEWFAERGAGRIELGVLARNAGAMDFWRAQGFETFRVVMSLDPEKRR